MPGKSKKGSLSISLPTVDAATTESDPLEKEIVSERSSYIPPARVNKKGILVYVRPSWHKALKQIALDKDSTLQSQIESLLEEYISDNGIDPSNLA